jgi:hypothetical protein
VFAEPLAAALRITEQIECAGRRGSCGRRPRLGLLCAHVLALAGAQVTVAGHHPGRPRCRARVCATSSQLLDGDGRNRARPGERPRSRRRSAAAGGRGDRQTPAVLPRLLRHVEPCGNGPCSRRPPSDTPSSTSAPLVVDEQTLLGSRCGRLGAGARLLASGRIPVEEFVAARYPLERRARRSSSAARHGTRRS